MSVNGISYNPYLYTGVKSASNSLGAAENGACYTNPIVSGDEFSSNTTTQVAQGTLASELKAQLKETKSKQGLIGGAWDGIKNFFGFGAGSNKAEAAIEKFEKGEISQEEAIKAVDGYQKGQKQCVDMVADVAAGIVAFAAFSLATGIEIAAAPFTGGTSLGLVAAGFGIAGAAGAATKVAIKGTDAAIGGREYTGKDALYDVATGAVNGISAPLTAGIGAAAGKAVAGKVGVTVIANEGAEILLKEGLKGTAKGALTKTLLTTSVEYAGGTMATRALALGTDMAVNGAISGALDSGVRYIAGDEENKSLEGFASNVAQGTVGGLIAAPIIGGGMRFAGKGIGKVTNKLANKIDTNYTQAKSAFMNTPVVESADKEVAQGLAGVAKEAQNIVSDVHLKGSEFLEATSRNLTDISNSVDALAKNASLLNADLSATSSENRAIVSEILSDLASGRSVDSKIAKLTEKGISIVDMLDTKIGTVSVDVEDKIAKLITANDDLSKRAADALSFAGETIDRTAKLANDAAGHVERIPDTEFYKQLGDLPERTQKLYSTLKADATGVEEIGKMARAKLLTGDVMEGLSDLTKYYNELDVFNANLEKQISQMQSSASRSGILDSAEVLRDRFNSRMYSADFDSLSRTQQVQAIVEDANIGLSKMIQTYSSDESLPPDLKQFFKQFTSNATTSRDITQAQALANELYGNGKYELIKSFGAGTIGETYLAKGVDGQEVVIKMLKDGVTPEKFAADRKMFTNYINEFVTDAADKEYKTKLINGMFDAWDKELNFGLEAQGAKEMAAGAQRFNVAQTIEVGTTKGGQNVSLVMEKADGIGLDSLISMVEYKKVHPTDFLTSGTKETNPWIKNAGFVEKNPALASSDTWIEDLGKAYQRAQNEQAMFISKTGSKTVHADPHGGNVFVDFDAAGKAKITYIDTGNVVQRTNSEVIKDVGLSLNMMIGNSQGIAESILEGATLPNGANKVQLAEQMAQMLDDKLYKAGVNLKSTAYTQNTINGIMKELGVIPNAENSNLMKATLQRIQTSREIAKVTGVPSSKSVDIKDLGSAILKSFKSNPKETWATIKPIIQWAYKNNDQAMITFFQMIMKNAQAQTA